MMNQWKYLVVFGINCSSFLLNATIRLHVEKYILEYNNVSKQFIRDIYVEDFASGVFEVLHVWRGIRFKEMAYKFQSLNGIRRWQHDLLIEYGPICHIVKLPISMIRPFSLVNNSHITLYPQLEIFTQILGEIFYILYYKLYNARLYYSWKYNFWYSGRYPY